MTSDKFLQALQLPEMWPPGKTMVWSPCLYLLPVTLMSVFLHFKKGQGESCLPADFGAVRE